MLRYVDVLPDPGRALSQLFTYRVPPALASSLRLGCQVLVPFGPRTVVGLVAAFRETSERTDLKEVETVLEGGPVLPEDALPLAEWIAEHYLCDLGEAIRLFLPHGGSYRITRRFGLTGAEIPPELRLHPDAGPVIRALEVSGKEDGRRLPAQGSGGCAAEEGRRLPAQGSGGSAAQVSHAALRRVLPAARLSRALQLLKARRAVVETATLRPPSARQRRLRLVEVASEAEAECYCAQQGKRGHARRSCLQASMESGPLAPASLARRAGVSLSVVQGLVKAGLLRERWVSVRRTPWKEEVGEPAVPLVLTDEQAEAVAAIAQAVEAQEPGSFLLYGVTASGKTEVFLRAIERVISLGKQALVLMPEISLTAQAVGLYRARFGPACRPFWTPTGSLRVPEGPAGRDRVAVLHSALSTGERWDEWERIRKGEAVVVIGARSALFAPASALGLIVVDEEHETSYKQEQAPRYSAREVALKRGELARCPVVLASATPSLESFYRAESGDHRLLRLPSRVEQRPLPTVRIVDMRGRTAHPPIFSPLMRQEIGARVQVGEQVILFLNRRGFATFLLCPMCGEAARCPECGVALTYHKAARQVRCHHCGMAKIAPEACASCGSLEIRFSGFGTERVESELARLVPQARVGRLDRDTVAGKDAHLRIVGSFREAKTDVLVGTQMVAKGFDFPLVTLVGVVSADRSLNLPDFRAAERTFQLLTQVAGRSGRGEKLGQVVIQTYQPEHYSIQAAVEQDYEAFYRHEIEVRRELNYPPFSELVNITISSPDSAEAARRAEQVASRIREAAAESDVEVLGPARAPLPRLRGRYRWHVLVRAAPGLAQPALRDITPGWRNWARGSITVDVDPYSFM